jgi:uncharacterized protein YodC (DUF2158 family)
MTGFQSEDRVRLKRDIPNLLLFSGSEGVVKSKWFSEAYEVEFRQQGEPATIRALVFAEQIESTDGMAAAS